MRMFGYRFLAIVLSLALLLSFPVSAHGQQVAVQQFAPISVNVTISEPLNAPGGVQGDELDYLTSADEVAVALRKAMQDRETVITIPYKTTSLDEQALLDIFHAAVEHTGDPTQGDYLLRQIDGCDMGANGYIIGAVNYLELTFIPEYYTTASQEAQMDAAIEAVLDQLNVYNATDYEKICAIYDYICEHVTYDHAGLAAGNSKLIYTAYAALINGTAVCQGYANLFYRLALELDVDNRIISGTGNGGPHAWNIVKLDGKYYDLDATWDSSRAQAGWEYDYFLRCEDNFGDHARDAEYLTGAFQSRYPMASKDYSLPETSLVGDIDGKNGVDSDDVIQLLLYVAMPDFFPIDVPADFTGDGEVTSDDVVQLLLHVAMPDFFPLVA